MKKMVSEDKTSGIYMIGNTAFSVENGEVDMLDDGKPYHLLVEKGFHYVLVFPLSEEAPIIPETALESVTALPEVLPFPFTSAEIQIETIFPETGIPVSKESDA